MEKIYIIFFIWIISVDHVKVAILKYAHRFKALVAASRGPVERYRPVKRSPKST